MTMRERGFTLVELLAAMAIGSLLLLVLAAYTSSLGRELRQRDKASETEVVGNLSPVLARLLEQSLAAGAGGEDISMNDRELEATIAPPQVIAAAGPIRVKLEAVRAGTGEDLEFSVEPAAGQELPEGVTHPLKLVSGMRDIRFRKAGEGGTEAPGAIEIAMRSRTGHELVMAAEPRISASASCRFDPVSMACR